MYKILLCCASGITTNKLVNAVKSAAKERNIKVMCWAMGEMSAHLSWADADCVLVAPQTASHFDSIKELVHGIIPCEMINKQDYIEMNGQAILDQVIELVK